MIIKKLYCLCVSVCVYVNNYSLYISIYIWTVFVWMYLSLFVYVVNLKNTLQLKYAFYIHCVRVLSLRSSVIHGFVTEPWYSHHVRVFMWARGFECARVARSLVCVPCFMLERGVWIPALMSWVSVTWRGSDTRAPFSVIVWVRGLEFARHRALLSTCVLLCCTQFVFLSAACIYVISCAVWHAAYIFIGCVLSCCHVLCEHVAYEFSH